VKRFLAAVVAAVLAVIVAVPAAGARASEQRAVGNVKIGGVLWSSVGTGIIDLTPGVEAVDLANYSFFTKNLKGYHLKSGPDVIPLCRIDHPSPGTNVLHECMSVILDDDSDGTVNKDDGDSWVSLPARSQLLYNVEYANDGPMLSNVAADVRLYNSVGTLVSRFQYKVS
jgi:hypothetical protein